MHARGAAKELKVVPEEIIKRVRGELEKKLKSYLEEKVRKVIRGAIADAAINFFM